MVQSSDESHISLLSNLLIRGYGTDFSSPVCDLARLEPELDRFSSLTEKEFAQLVGIAALHHVTVRAFRVVEHTAHERDDTAVERCRTAIERQHQRILRAVEWLYAIVQALESSGCPICVIKSLDHWPDLGSDLDLYTSGTPKQVLAVMEEKLHPSKVQRSLGDRLANKWNFQIPGLPELVEIHIGYLGQTGEQKLLAERVLERKVTKTVNGRTFSVPAPEERILIATLQRMYRHFYFRLCDIADTAALLGSGVVDFSELRRAAAAAGVWPGVASFLMIVSRYVEDCGGQLPLPGEIARSAHSPFFQLQLRDNFLRLPMRSAIELYGWQLLNAGRHRDLRALARLPLLPPLAVSALLAYQLTGSDKGVW
jgi:hypothetical protein